MKTARGMVRPWTKHGRSLMASTDGLCLLQRLGQSLQNLRWPRDGTPDDNVLTTLLNLIYKCGFQPKLPERGCERSHKDWLISLLPGMSSGLERSTSRLSSPCWAISQQSRYAQEYLCIFLSPVFFSLLGAKNLRHQDVCHVSGGRLKITWFSAWFGRTCCDPEVCQTVTSPWSSRMAFASLSLAQPRKSKPLWHRFGRKRMCNDVIHSGH